jgi:magnesium transporter
MWAACAGGMQSLLHVERARTIFKKGSPGRGAFTCHERDGPEVETVHILYAVDEDWRLVGCVSLLSLLPAPPDRRIADMMERRLLTVHTDTPQAEVARMVSKYDVHAIPVVAEDNKLLGIVTVDDAIDILIEEQTEDALHMGGVSANEETVEQGYFASKPWRNVRLRFNWLLLLFVTETLTGTVLRHYESELAKVVALSFFIPLLIGTGGNSGSQTVTTIVRGLAVGDIRRRDFWRVVGRFRGFLPVRWLRRRRLFNRAETYRGLEPADRH